MKTPVTRTPAPVTIVVKQRPMVVPPKRRLVRQADADPRPVAVSQIATRFAAEWVGGPHHGESVAGYETADEAVGALIREAAQRYEYTDEVLDFFAGLFGLRPDRSPDVQLARAVRLAGKNPRRVHPGVRVEIQPTAPKPGPGPGPGPGRAVKPARPKLADATAPTKLDEVKAKLALYVARPLAAQLATAKRPKGGVAL